MDPNETQDDWIATAHDRIYYDSKGDRFRRGEYQFAKKIAEHIPTWDILITMGPYRGHDIRHDIDPDRKLIHLDFYSAGMIICGPQYPHRPQNPAIEHFESVLQGIVDDIKETQD